MSDQPSPPDGGKESNQLLTVKTFEFFSPPPLNSIRGTFIPRVLEVRKRRRKIGIEVHLVHAAKDDKLKKSDGAFYEECIVRVLDRDHDEKKKAKLNKKHPQQQSELTVDDGDDTSISPEYLDHGSHDFPVSDVYHGWKTKYRFPINALTIKGTHKNSVIVEISLDKLRESRELIFDTHSEAEQFEAMIRRELSLEARRIEKKVEASFGTAKIDIGETITFLIEIVSGWNLPLGDFTSSDPYIKCYFNGKTVHKTDYISSALDPVWTVDNGSLFLFTVDVGTLFASEGLVCYLHDYDSLGKDELLGMIQISPRKIFDAKGERMEFKLQPPKGHKGDVTGHLYFRCRRATDYDKEFMAELNRVEKGGDFLGMKKLEKLTEGKGGAGAINSILTRKTKIAKHGKNAGKKVYKVRPGPDPARVEETTWMTKDDIQKECVKESLSWIDTGSGQFGRLFVEIIGCDDLPNMDTGGFAGNKTDAFVSLVFEDTMGRTDIIDDSLAPRWMPWSKRAFIFHMYHASSDLFIGVFDHDESINPTDDHDLIGRISVDLSNLRKNTVYMLTYDIFTTARMSNLSDKKIFRKRTGTVTFRLRIEVDDERLLLLSTLQPPPPMYVNVKNRKDFKVLQGTTEGKYNMHRYDQDVIYSYIDELLALKHAVLLIQDALFVLLLWRGTFEVKVGQTSVFVPIHSITAFLATTLLVEKPQLLVSYIFFSIGWILMAAMDYRSKFPDVWSRCRTFTELFEVLVFGQSQTPPDSITADETKKAAEEFLKSWKERIKASEEAAAKAYAESVKQQEEYEREMEGIGDETDIATKSGGISIDPLKIVLHPIQLQLAIVVKFVRYAKHVVLWQECYLSFWVTISCFLLAIICSFVPWFFLIKWTSRIIVWTVFGPWMKLVDIYYVSKIKPLTHEEEEKLKRERKEKQMLINKVAINQARIRRENAKKLKAMKKHLFGKYILGVPVLKEDRYIDLPLPESYAVPYRAEQKYLSELAMQDAGYRKIRIPGQHLVGDMIPKIETLSLTDAPVGQATTQPGRVNRQGPGGAILPGKDSTFSAYAQIGSLVFAAGILTWFGVPLLAAVTEKLLKLIVNSK